MSKKKIVYGICPRCRKYDHLTKEHVFVKGIGGTTTIWICYTCNNSFSSSDKYLKDFIDMEWFLRGFDCGKNGIKYGNKILMGNPFRNPKKKIKVVSANGTEVVESESLYPVDPEKLENFYTKIVPGLRNNLEKYIIKAAPSIYKSFFNFVIWRAEKLQVESIIFSDKIFELRNLPQMDDGTWKLIYSNPPRGYDDEIKIILSPFGRNDVYFYIRGSLFEIIILSPSCFYVCSKMLGPGVSHTFQLKNKMGHLFNAFKTNSQNKFNFSMGPKNVPTIS